MTKDMKEDRLSFRITDEVNEQIDIYVDRYSSIKDRSDFGNRAISSFVNYIQFENETIELISKALKKLAKKVGAEKFDEIKDLDLLLSK